MRQAHTCPTCGADLGACHAPADPVYGLPIVVCPGCGYACVRRRHPMERGWSRLQRAGWALARLLVQAAAIAITTGTLSVYIVDARRELWGMGCTWSQFPAQLLGFGRTKAVGDWLESGGRGDLVIWVIVSVIAGAWLRAGLSHWRSGRLLIGWLVVLGVGVTLEPVGAWIQAWFDWMDGRQFVYRGAHVAQWADSLSGVVQTAVLSAAGVPLGALLVRLAPKYRAWRIGRMRGAIRKLRQA